MNDNSIKIGEQGGTPNIIIAGGKNVAADSYIRIKGDLIVEGTTTQLNVTDLAVEDKFILLNSHSAGTAILSDAGIIVQTSGSTGAGDVHSHFGTALYYSQDQNRWVLAQSSSVEAGATSITQNDGFIVTITSSYETPLAAYPLLNQHPFGVDEASRYGTMFIDRNDDISGSGGLYIYLPG
jgi:hypothetical protein